MIFHKYIKRPGGQSLTRLVFLYAYVWSVRPMLPPGSAACVACDLCNRDAVSTKHRSGMSTQASGSVLSVSARMISFAYGRVSIQWQKVCHSSSLWFFRAK